ncbi:hypothetical protein Mycsm_05919 [Mycobacterium sp. JS623]|uniref:DUF6779 domain-containing protein n=1 Tax=Mycobacterium sp. JS623 TaxID=212767 RepID=UPI0002A584D9|nr:DUF6779 domain-containing protein [Mycobacterium sp. JS623]AGB26086.1 hypothetical protein Mycsm_05919 [Mycobacterium sp. JS623]
MADLSRGRRSRRAARRPGWVLLTVLLVLAIGASSALVFTNKVELLKLAVILALWAAVVAAFVSVIYRRQSDIDQAKVRDLKLVYDLQLDREISARREYELTVETQLRRELTSEIRAQAADEVAGLRAELAALRANLEILFDADLSHRPAIETDRSREYGDWPRVPESAGRVTASRIDAEDRDDLDANTEESPIIDVSAEPHTPEADWAPMAGGAHRRPSETEQERARRHRVEEQPRAWSPPPSATETTTQFTWEPTQQERPPAPPPEAPAPPPEPPPPPRSEPEPPPEPEPTPEPHPVAQEEPVAEDPNWQPAPADGQWIPAGAPGSNWVAPAATDAPAENGSAAEYVGRRRAPEPAPAYGPAQPAMQSPPAEPRRGRHSAPPETGDPGRPPAPPSLHAESAGPPPHSEPEPAPATEPPPAEPEGRRHRSAEDTGGQSVAELLARLQATPTGGGRRRRRDE